MEWRNRLSVTFWLGGPWLGKPPRWKMLWVIPYWVFSVTRNKVELANGAEIDDLDVFKLDQYARRMMKFDAQTGERMLRVCRFINRGKIQCFPSKHENLSQTHVCILGLHVLVSRTTLNLGSAD